MDPDRLGRTVVSGIGAVAVVLVACPLAFYVALPGEAFNPYSSGSGERAEGTDPIRAAAYSLVFVAFALAGALPARALGLGWPGDFVLSGVATGILLVVVLAAGPSYGRVLAAVVAAPVLVALVASLLTNSTRATMIVASGAVAFVVAVAVVYSTSTLAGFAVGLSGWVLLPAMAGLFNPTGTAD
ncbi:hypothetical protein GBA65_07200 [Rubrobacter marinus]|uniref:Uncharacterized protein n=1 Tax=Rubrobacter marinus TaxID=2653852 RepID=A0A6G8PVV9_9ACTN|nr:hypothetical protein [Rubrobacter marinus]QIN78340.1 hypothetical protein GBA65_07200 [Rubrobacter marinus]